MKSMMSVRGQTVVPAEIRRALSIRPGQRLVWELQEGKAIVGVLPEDPVRASIGIAKGMGTYEQFMRERRIERNRERHEEEHREP